MTENIAPEFSRIVKIDEVTEKKTSIDVEATAEECAALAERFELIGIEKLNAALTILVAGNDEVTVRGTMHAEITQRCVVTLEPVSDVIDDQIEVLYSPHVSEDDLPSSPEDLEGLDEDELMALLDQPEPLVGGQIDVGEVVSQFLAVSMDPYPRKSGAEIPQTVKEDDAEEKPNPFTKLAGLKDKLENKN